MGDLGRFNDEFSDVYACVTIAFISNNDVGVVISCKCSGLLWKSTSCFLKDFSEITYSVSGAVTVNMAVSNTSSIIFPQIEAVNHMEVIQTSY